MKHSAACTALVKASEGCRLQAYRDPVGIPTIGYGSTGKDVSMGLTWTQAQADARLQSDLAKADASLNLLLNGAPTTQGQYDSLADFLYNLGARSLGTSTLLKKHLAGDYAAAAAEFGKWVSAGKPKQVLPGLVKRRAAEKAMYQGTAT